MVERYSAQGAIVLEPTELNVYLAHKGFAWATVEVFGRAAHGSHYQKGIDAISKMGEVLTRVRNIGEDMLKGKTHPLVGPASLHASLIEGGQSLSTYRTTARLSLKSEPYRTRTQPNSPVN